jgi:hypothetical protein
VQNPQLQRNVPIIEKHVELKTIKMSQLEFGTSGWPPISTWINRYCVGTIIGEEIISSFAYAICFYWIEGVEDAVVVVAFCASFEQTVKRMNFAV